MILVNSFKYMIPDLKSAQKNASETSYFDIPSYKKKNPKKAFF